MRYFHIMQGLTGCYMPDSNNVISVNTRRELKRALEDEAYYLRDAGMVGLSKRAISWLANAAWKGNSSRVDYGTSYQSPSKPYGLECIPTDRATYLEAMSEEN